MSDGAQSVLVTNGSWELNVADGSLVTLTATADNPSYTISSDFPKPYRVVDDVITLPFFVDIPGAMPRTGFTSSGTNSDDTVGTVQIPVTMTLPPGVTNWGGNQVFHCTIDESSTADYGVDYTMSAATITFYGALTPAPYLIPLTILHDAVPKNKTVVIKITPGSSVATLGPISTFTYTIHNAPYRAALSGLSISNRAVSFVITNLSASATNYVLRCHDLLAPFWTTSHIFTGVSGQIQWTEEFSNAWERAYYRIHSE